MLLANINKIAAALEAKTSFTLPQIRQNATNRNDAFRIMRVRNAFTTSTSQRMRPSTPTNCRLGKLCGFLVPAPGGKLVLSKCEKIHRAREPCFRHTASRRIGGSSRRRTKRTCKERRCRSFLQRTKNYNVPTISFVDSMPLHDQTLDAESQLTSALYLPINFGTGHSKTLPRTPPVRTEVWSGVNTTE